MEQRNAPQSDPVDGGDAIAALIDAGRRTTRAFIAIGKAKGVVDTLRGQRECEDALVALDAALTRVTGAQA